MVDPTDLSKMDFLVDPGQAPGAGAMALVKYFLAGLTVPARDLWVNLSPYEKERIIPDGMGNTEVGRVFLEQDYLLKQMSAGLLDPTKGTGRHFWDEVYRLSADKFGTTDIPMEALSRVWVVPEQPVVYEKKLAAPLSAIEGKRLAGGQVVGFIVKARLKVLTQEDYALSADQRPAGAAARQEQQQLSTQVMREVIIPVLEREVNEGVSFAPLRQVYHSLILSGWLKQRLHAGVLDRYVDKNKTAGISHGEAGLKDKVYARYVAAFRQGEVNTIREDMDALTGELIPRKYFSGGFSFDAAQAPVVIEAMPPTQLPGAFNVFRVKMSVIGAQPALLQEEDLPGGARLLSRVQAPVATEFPQGMQVAALPDGSGRLAVAVLKDRRWGSDHTSLTQLEEAFRFPVWEHIRATAALYQKRGEVLTVLDWGTGDGTALVEMARRAKAEGIANIRFFGFGDIYYPSWREAPSGVTFIWDTAAGLREYIQPGQVGFLFSHLGLTHLPLPAYEAYMPELNKLLGVDGLMLQRNVEGATAGQRRKILETLGFVVSNPDGDPARIVASRPGIDSTPLTVWQKPDGRYSLRRDGQEYVLKSRIRGNDWQAWEYDPQRELLMARVLLPNEPGMGRFHLAFDARNGRLLYELNNRTLFFRSSEYWAASLERYLSFLLVDKLRQGDRHLSAVSFGAASGAEAWTMAAMIEQALRNAHEDPALWDVRIHALDLVPQALQYEFSSREVERAFKAVKYDAGRIFDLSLEAGVARVKEPFRSWLRPQRMDFNDENIVSTLASLKANVFIANHVLEHLDRRAKERLEPFFQAQGGMDPYYPAFMLYTTAQQGELFRVRNGYDASMSTQEQYDGVYRQFAAESAFNQERIADEKLLPSVAAYIAVAGLDPQVAQALHFEALFRKGAIAEKDPFIKEALERSASLILWHAARPVLVESQPMRVFLSYSDAVARQMQVLSEDLGPQKKLIEEKVARLLWQIALLSSGREASSFSVGSHARMELLLMFRVFVSSLKAPMASGDRQGLYEALHSMLLAAQEVLLIVSDRGAAGSQQLERAVASLHEKNREVIRHYTLGSQEHGRVNQGGGVHQEARLLYQRAVEAATENARSSEEGGLSAVMAADLLLSEVHVGVAGALLLSALLKAEAERISEKGSYLKDVLERMSVQVLPLAARKVLMEAAETQDIAELIDVLNEDLEVSSQLSPEEKKSLQGLLYVFFWNMAKQLGDIKALPPNERVLLVSRLFMGLSIVVTGLNYLGMVKERQECLAAMRGVLVAAEGVMQGVGHATLSEKLKGFSVRARELGKFFTNDNSQAGEDDPQERKDLLLEGEPLLGRFRQDVRDGMFRWYRQVMGGVDKKREEGMFYPVAANILMMMPGDLPGTGHSKELKFVIRDSRERSGFSTLGLLKDSLGGVLNIRKEKYTVRWNGVALEFSGFVHTGRDGQLYRGAIGPVYDRRVRRPAIELPLEGQWRSLNGRAYTSSQPVTGQAPGGVDMGVAVAPKVEGDAGAAVGSGGNDVEVVMAGIEPVLLSIRPVEDLSVLLGMK
ncbi:MAG: CheR family methyltransferase [Candidatus Omnitrophota bacterium]